MLVSITVMGHEYVVSIDKNLISSLPYKWHLGYEHYIAAGEYPSGDDMGDVSPLNFIFCEAVEDTIENMEDYGEVWDEEE